MLGGAPTRLAACVVTVFVAHPTIARAQTPTLQGQVTNEDDGHAVSPGADVYNSNTGGGNPNCPPPRLPDGTTPRNWSCPTGTQGVGPPLYGNIRSNGRTRCQGGEPGTYVLPSAVANRLYALGAWQRCAWCPGDRFVCWPKPGAEPGIAKALGQSPQPTPQQQTPQQRPQYPNTNNPVAPGADPMLAGIAEAARECGQAYRQLLQLPGLLLTGNFIEAARVLGVQPGQSLVLQTITQELRRLTQELNVPILRSQNMPYDAGLRIGRRICSYGIRIAHEPRQARPNPRLPGPIEERPLPRGPIPTDFRSIAADSTVRYQFNASAMTAEGVGEAGMAAEAARRGYWPLLPPERASSVPQGFDGIYWDSNTAAIVVGEAKGGYNGFDLDHLLGYGYGARQGTLAWVEQAAQRITRSLRTNNLEVRYAEQILTRALRDRKVPIRVEVFHTEYVNGSPGVTRHYVVDHSP